MTLRPAPTGSLLKGSAPKPAKKQDGRKDASHLDFIRSLPCIITGKRPVEAAHIRFGSKLHGKPQTGIAIKPDDRWTVPLCPEMHRDQHANGEWAWWCAKGIDPLVTASRLWFASGDLTEGERIIADAIATQREKP